MRVDAKKENSSASLFAQAYGFKCSYPQAEPAASLLPWGQVRLLSLLRSTPGESSKMDWVKNRNVHFLGLQTAAFCVACELISENNTPYCLACGSQSVISLSRVLGGSLRGQQTAHLIADAELDRLVHALIRTVPVTSVPALDSHLPVSFASLAPGRSHVRRSAQTQPGVAT